jgi:hypothetical protein
MNRILPLYLQFEIEVIQEDMHIQNFKDFATSDFYVRMDNVRVNCVFHSLDARLSKYAAVYQLPGALGRRYHLVWNDPIRSDTHIRLIEGHIIDNEQP